MSSEFTIFIKALEPIIKSHLPNQLNYGVGLFIGELL